MKTYIIRGHKWSKVATFYDWDKERKYPNYDSLEDQVEITKDFEDMNEAHLWLLRNLPEYAIGCSIRCPENGDFMIEAVKGYQVLQFGTDDETVIVQRILEYEEEIVRKAQLGEFALC